MEYSYAFIRICNMRTCIYVYIYVCVCVHKKICSFMPGRLSH